jgi:hypothetical protein
MTAQPDNAALLEEVRRGLRAARDRRRGEERDHDFLRELAVAGLQATDSLAAALAAVEEVERWCPNCTGRGHVRDSMHVNPVICGRCDGRGRIPSDSALQQIAAAEERAQAAEQSNAELTALGIDRELALEDSRAQVRELKQRLGDEDV